MTSYPLHLDEDKIKTVLNHQWFWQPVSNPSQHIMVSEGLRARSTRLLPSINASKPPGNKKEHTTKQTKIIPLLYPYLYHSLCLYPPYGYIKHFYISYIYIYHISYHIYISYHIISYHMIYMYMYIYIIYIYHMYISINIYKHI
jgi:hypothetical protein